MGKLQIGIVLARTAEDHSFKPEPSYRFQFLKEQYYEPLEPRGLLPLGIPATERLENVGDYCKLIHGLLLVGGEDVNPECYGEMVGDAARTLPPQRDRLEIEMVRACLARGIPILGICRGLQIMNVAAGGTLYQDLSGCPGAGDHRQTGELDFSTAHEVEIVPGTKLHEVLDRDRIVTNTGHHEGIKELGRDLTVSARAVDGVIEAVEGAGFSLAVQWHPESWAVDEISRKLFDSFAAAAERFAAQGRRR